MEHVHAGWDTWIPIWATGLLLVTLLWVGGRAQFWSLDRAGTLAYVLVVLLGFSMAMSFLVRRAKLDHGVGSR